jgi:hypothetical protein
VYVFNISDIVAWISTYDGSSSIHDAAGRCRAAHRYKFRRPIQRRPRSSGYGREFCRSWLIPTGTKFVEGLCYTYLQLKTPQYFADLKRLLKQPLLVERSPLSNGSSLECGCDGFLKYAVLQSSRQVCSLFAHVLSCMCVNLPVFFFAQSAITKIELGHYQVQQWFSMRYAILFVREGFYL